MLSWSELLNPAPPSPTSRQVQPPSLSRDASYEVRERVDITRQQDVERLYSYGIGTLVEYPETSTTGRIGHLFELDTNNWFNPTTAFAYSQGIPEGRSKKGQELHCELLVDEEGNMVPCTVIHSTCQGCKVCPVMDLSTVKKHCIATRDDLRTQLEQHRRSDYIQHSPSRDIFEKTLALWTAFQDLGCPAPPKEHTEYHGVEKTERERVTSMQDEVRRGHNAKRTCEGRLLLEYDHHGVAFVRCEHYDHQNSRDHLVNYDVGKGLYDLDYLEALFGRDIAQAEFIEEMAKGKGYGPLAACSTISNVSSVKVDCPVQHRDDNGLIIKSKMTHLPCKSKFRVYMPWPEYRQSCAKVLVVCWGEHSHPIPLPTKTPPTLRNEILRVMESLEHDLPDLTPRRFMRHPNVRAYVRNRLPAIHHPMLSDLHSSLANRDHLRAYIRQAQDKCFPFGTDWAGVLHAKRVQDETLPPEQRYIRIVHEASLGDGVLDLDIIEDGDNEEIYKPGDRFRMVVCMTPESSRRLSRAQYVQSDISFKRVAGYLDFALGGLEDNSRTSIVYCRVYLNRQSAAAHKLVFQAIEKIVKEDTGSSLRWRHLHADHLEDISGIVHWAADQHRGQAKGLGLHLQSLAQAISNKQDLHEPHRRVADLSEYEHLHRMYRLCDAHMKRNIRNINTSEPVRNKMRSLQCVQHPNFDATVQEIMTEGGNEAFNWVQDKYSSKFAFEAMCWQKSHIPKSVWMLGDNTTNITEGQHANTNLEGIHATLVGGIRNGENYDNMKLKGLVTLETAGIRPTYKRNHPSESATKNLKRKATFRHKALVTQDSRILKHNAKLAKTSQSRDTAEARLQLQIASNVDAEAINKARSARDRAEKAYQKVLDERSGLAGSGTGDRLLLSPSSVARRSMGGRADH